MVALVVVVSQLTHRVVVRVVVFTSRQLPLVARVQLPPTVVMAAMVAVLVRVVRVVAAASFWFLKFIVLAALRPLRQVQLLPFLLLLPLVRLVLPHSLHIHQVIYIPGSIVLNLVQLIQHSWQQPHLLFPRFLLIQKLVM